MATLLAINRTRKSKHLCPFTHFLARCFCSVFFFFNLLNSADGYRCQFNAAWEGQSQTVMWWGWPSVLFCACLSESPGGSFLPFYWRARVSLKGQEGRTAFPTAWCGLLPGPDLTGFSLSLPLSLIVWLIHTHTHTHSPLPSPSQQWQSIPSSR